MVRDYQLKLIHIEKEAPDIYSHFFEKPEGFEYMAGQYLKVTIPLTYDDSRGSTRFFTISSSPTEDHLRIATKMQQSQFKHQLHNLKPGDFLSVRGPYGTFTLDLDDDRTHVFIAGGMGVTPYRSIIRSVVDLDIFIPIVLIYTFSSLEQALFLHELQSFADKKKFVKLFPVNSSKTGRLSRDQLKNALENLSHCVYYITGPTEMVDETISLLQSFSVDLSDIRKEYFSGYRYE